MTRPRAADDFATIRLRMEELRRERDQSLADASDEAAAERPLPSRILRGESDRQRLAREMRLLPSARRSPIR